MEILLRTHVLLVSTFFSVFPLIMPYTVVETIGSYGKEVSAVPAIWIKNNFVFWPPKQKLKLYRKEMRPIENNWQPFKYKILQKNLCE